MITCRRAAELVSRSLETPLRWWQRLALASHLWLCRACRRFRRQSQLVQQAGRLAGADGHGEGGLPEAARERIKHALEQAGGEGAP
jgi:hypothetical protein